MKIAILGYGIQGRSAFEYWNRDGNGITICDRNDDLKLPEHVGSQLGLDYLNNLDDFDLIVRSPNVHPNDIVSANSASILAKVTTPTNEFMSVCPTKNVIGVTGTKGKGTTSSLITTILEMNGKTVHLGGNFGISPLDLLKKGIAAEDWVVLELANFQLVDLKTDPHIAVCLMIAPEHLDWHTDMDEYVESKSQLFVHQNPDDIAVYYAKNDNSKLIASKGQAKKIPFFEKPGAVVEDGEFKIDGKSICATSEIKLLGEHNWQNVAAAITATWQISQDVQKLRAALLNFKSLDNRLELVREIDGVKYYNDSFGSAPDATVAAIKAIPGTKIIVIGGFDRNLPLQSLVDIIKVNSKDLRTIVLIGASSDRVSTELQQAGFSNFKLVDSKDMKEIVRQVRELAKHGDSVVLSPGFPSFDMFKNFEERGRQFREVVNEL